MSDEARILLIGFGNMGQALARGWLATRVAPSAIEIVDPAPHSRAIAAELGLAASPAVEARSRSGVVVFAVKPNQFAAALDSCRPLASGQPVFLSIAAGKTIRQMTDVLGATAAVVRAMPNTPAAIGQGMTVLTANENVTPAQRALCGDLLAAVGAVAWVDDEGLLDAVTAISGCGPAYVFLLIECLERAAIEIGLDAKLARQLATVTVAGAGAYARSSAEDAAELKRRVASPGGSTQAALAVLGGEHGLEELIGRAVRAAAERSRELARS